MVRLLQAWIGKAPPIAGASSINFQISAAATPPRGGISARAEEATRASSGSAADGILHSGAVAAAAIARGFASESDLKTFTAA